MARRASLLLLLPLILIAACDEESGPMDPDPDPDPGQGHVFVYTPPTGAPAVQSVSLRGSFNTWNERPMQRQPDDSWRVVIALPTGTHTYKFYINGTWPLDMCYDDTWGDPANDYWIDPDADGCESDGLGGMNAVAAVGVTLGLGFDHGVTSPAQLSGASGRVSVRFRVNANRVQSAAVNAAGDTFPMHLQLRYGSQEVWRASLPETVTSYGITVITATDTTAHGPYDVPATLFREVPWVGDAVGYQIFPERFWNGDASNDALTLSTDSYAFLHPDFRGPAPVLTQQWNGPMLEGHCCHQYFGGDFAGIVQKLDHLQALGVTLIYMNPITHSGSAHGYDTFDYLQIAPEFGGETALAALRDAAHARGMRLMWDFVPNHTGVGHWAFQHAVQNGESSPYWSWFNFKVPSDQIQVGNGGHYDGWWGIGELPELNTLNADVQAHLMEATRRWTEFGMDAIRVDVPQEISNARQFFPAFRQAAKSVNPAVYLIGEVWSRDPVWLEGDEFDSLMNYAIGLDVIRLFVMGARTPGSAARDMALLYAEYPEAATAMQFNLISSHDTSRLLTLLGGGTLGVTPSAIALGRQRLASAMLYGLPGVPVTFQGDECAFLGQAGNGDEHRYPVQWDACNADMLAHYRDLAQLKANVAALRSPVIRAPAGAGTVLSFLRGEPGAGEVFAVFNAALQSQPVALPAGGWTDAVSGTTVSGTLTVESLGWAYLVRQ